MVDFIAYLHVVAFTEHSITGGVSASSTRITLGH
jgi:hypothetical protein